MDRHNTESNSFFLKNITHNLIVDSLIKHQVEEEKTLTIDWQKASSQMNIRPQKKI